MGGEARGEKQLDRGLSRLISYYRIDFFDLSGAPLPLCFPASLRLRDSSGVL